MGWLNLLIFSSFIHFCMISIFVKGHIRNLRNFDLIDNPKIRVKRSLTQNKEIRIDTKFKNFKVILNPNKHLFVKGFKAFNVDANGNKEEILIDPGQYYEGYVPGNIRSSVSATVSSGDEITINIDDGDELYKIEPASRYDESYHNKTIAYRLSDIINISKVKRQPPIKLRPYLTRKFKDINRSKRQANNLSSERLKEIFSFIPSDESLRKKYCTIVLVADYLFHKKFGKGNKHKTYRFLIEILNNINQIYEKAVFVDRNNRTYQGIRFIISKIIVHQEPTNKTGHYNEIQTGFQDNWQTRTLLQKFSELNTENACLSHLFTYQRFSSGILGLSYMASHEYFNRGGICSKTPGDFNEVINTNTGWSTYRDAFGKPLVSMSAYLVTAHELGHNMGSDHDPGTIECSPTSGNGGKYIMYTYSVVGNEPNNKKFSPCSIRTIGETLRHHSSTCLKSEVEVQTEYCGNNRIEEGEECDVGKTSSDPCCDSNCKLRKSASCSPDNHQCCTDTCQLSKRGTVCTEMSPLHSCLGSAFCTGLSKHCPAPKTLSGVNCTEHGKCRDGVCQPFCQHYFNLDACICDDVSDSCLICCRAKTNTSTSSVCKPAHHFLKPSISVIEHLTLNDGRPCLQGMCQKGVCKKNRNKLIERIWKIIENFNTNLFVALLVDNLVCIVIILSLVIWIPASLLVNYYDKSQELQLFSTIRK